MLPLYEQLLNSKKETAKNIFEVGIQNRGSIKLWFHYFTNANVHDIDIMHIDNVYKDVKIKENYFIYCI